MAAGGLYARGFEKDGREVRMRVEGRLVFNSPAAVLKAALAGFGLAFDFEDLMKPHLRRGELVQALDDWTPPFSGYHLYYPSRRQLSPAFSVLVNALRYRSKKEALIEPPKRHDL
jgi:DNA-binding transcriptional LysR family regulator